MIAVDINPTMKAVAGTQLVHCCGLGVNVKKGRLTAILPHMAVSVNAAGLCDSCQEVQNKARATGAGGKGLVDDKERQTIHRWVKDAKALPAGFKGNKLSLRAAEKRLTTGQFLELEEFMAQSVAAGEDKMRTEQHKINGAATTVYFPKNVPLNNPPNGPNTDLIIPVVAAEEIRKLAGKPAWKGDDPSENYVIPNFGTMTISFRHNGGKNIKAHLYAPGSERTNLAQGFYVTMVNGVPGIGLFNQLTKVIGPGPTPPPPITDIWAAWDHARGKYTQKKRDVTPRSAPLPGVIPKERKDIPQECKRFFPDYVVQYEADQIERIDPVTTLKEGVVLRLKDTNDFWEIELTGDHKEAFNGHNTVPENLQIISTIANNYKLDSTMTIEQMRDRIIEAGWRVASIPAEHIEILKMYGKVH